MPTRGATTVSCLESIRPVKKTTTNAAASPRPATLKTCFMGSPPKGEGPLSSNGRTSAMRDRHKRADTVYINSMNGPPKGQRLISRDEAPRAEDAARVPGRGRGTVWAIEHRYSRQTGESYDDGWGTLDQQAAEERLGP